VGIFLHQNLGKSDGLHPQTQRKLRNMPSIPHMPTAQMGQSLKVLLVEDSKVLTERLTDALHQITTVNLIGTVDTEAAAVAFVKRESVDVIILDLHLRLGTGFGVMRSLAATRLKPQIIVLTNYDLPEYKNAAFGLGATHFLDKARDYGRLPELLHAMWQAHHSIH
jgi:two-component system, OmpR family, response regulator